MMGVMSLGHWAIVILIIILLFGRGMISGFMGDIGKSLKILRGIGDDEDKKP
jgi:sec-independent protein translocase protein TatA